MCYEVKEGSYCILIRKLRHLWWSESHLSCCSQARGQAAWRCVACGLQAALIEFMPLSSQGCLLRDLSPQDGHLAVQDCYCSLHRTPTLMQ